MQFLSKKRTILLCFVLIGVTLSTCEIETNVKLKEPLADIVDAYLKYEHNVELFPTTHVLIIVTDNGLDSNELYITNARKDCKLIVDGNDDFYGKSIHEEYDVLFFGIPNEYLTKIKSQITNRTANKKDCPGVYDPVQWEIVFDKQNSIINTYPPNIGV